MKACKANDPKCCRPVRWWVFGPEVVVNGRRRPDFMEQVIHPSFLAFHFLLKLGSIAFNGLGIRRLSIEFLLLLWELKELPANFLQTGNNMKGNAMVDNLENSPLHTGHRNQSCEVGLIWVAEINGGNLRDIAMEGCDSRLFFFRSNELGWDGALR